MQLRSGAAPGPRTSAAMADAAEAPAGEQSLAALFQQGGDKIATQRCASACVLPPPHVRVPVRACG